MISVTAAAYSSESVMSETVRSSALLTTIPVAIVFFAFQRHFVRGANEGAEKG